MSWLYDAFGMIGYALSYPQCTGSDLREIWELHTVTHRFHSHLAAQSGVQNVTPQILREIILPRPDASGNQGLLIIT
jgi:hypothetical protein